MNHNIIDEFDILLDKLMSYRLRTFIIFQDALLLCLSGFSLDEVSIYLDIDRELVKHQCINYLGISPFEYNINISPWYIYRKVDGDYQNFHNILLTFLEKHDIILMYKGCEKFKAMREELDQYYERN